MLKIIACVLVVLFMNQRLCTAATLQVSIDGVKSDDGNILIALYNNSEAFPNLDSGYKKVLVSAYTSKIIFESIPAGSYSVSVFHDENGDGQLNKNFFGLPLEGYGFSNGARGVFGPPAFEQASIIVNEGNNAISINIDY